MKIDWNQVPNWIDWVTPESKYGTEVCIGWCSKPYLSEKYPYEWDNYYCSEDDGLWCELPHYVASFESSELEFFESMIEQRDNTKLDKVDNISD